MGSTNELTTMRIRTRLGELAVRVTGDGPATILWPSMFVDATSFDPLVPLLPDRRLVLVDGPGLGASEPLRHRSSIEEAAAAALDLLAGLRERGVLGDRPVDWVGNAFGGHVGYQLAVQPGVLRTLAAVSAPVEPIGAALRAQILVLAPMLRWMGPVGPVRTAVVAAMLTDASATDPVKRAAVQDSLARPTRRSLSLALNSFILDRVDVTDLLAQLQVPCLFVAGSDRGDWTPEAARRAAQRAPRATDVVVDDARTLVPLEQPAALAGELRRFWATVG